MKPGQSLVGRLSNQRALVGLLQSYPSPALAEMAGMCGYDFLFLDDEHGLFTAQDHLHALHACAAGDIAAMVRVSDHDPQAIGRYMDLGVDAVVVPNVSTAEQAMGLVRAMYYPPAGKRGFGASLHRITRYGIDVTAHRESPRQEVLLIVIIESVEGVTNVESILAVEGVDGAFVGPADLTADLGVPGDFSQGAYARALERIEQAAVACGKLLGTAPHPGYPLERLIAHGHRMLILGADMPLIREAMSTQVSQARSCLQR